MAAGRNIVRMVLVIVLSVLWTDGVIVVCKVMELVTVIVVEASMGSKVVVLVTVVVTSAVDGGSGAVAIVVVDVVLTSKVVEEKITASQVTAAGQRYEGGQTMEERPEDIFEARKVV